MAGHSKWANIRFRKNAQDAKRGKLFTKYIREITVAARMGGEDPSSNPRLRTAIDKALTSNMTKDTIERAIKRGVGGFEGQELSEILYEGYGPGGVAVMVFALTDNKNRTVAEVRHVFSKCGGNLGTDGSVAYLFQKRGEIAFAADYPEDRIMEQALELGAEDIVTDQDGTIAVYTAEKDFVIIKAGLVNAGFEPENAEIALRASIEVELDAESARQLLKMIDMLEDLDDVQNVYTNADIPDSVLEEF